MNRILPCVLLALFCCAFQASAQAPNITYTNSTITGFTGRAIAPLKVSNTGGVVPQVVFGRTTTFAGTGRAGSANGSLTTAGFNNPQGLTFNKDGVLFVADAGNHKIRRILTDGSVNHIAGTGEAGYADNSGFFAQFDTPTAIASDGAGNLYVIDSRNNRIRKINTNNVVSTFAGNGSTGFADGTSTAASFNLPQALTTDAAGNVYVADGQNFRLRKITPAGVVSGFSGTASIPQSGYIDGSAVNARFQLPTGITTDMAGNLYVGDKELLRKVLPDGSTTTHAGKPGQNTTTDGAAVAATLSNVQQLAADQNGNLFFTQGDNTIRMATNSNLVVTLAGGTQGNANGVGTAAQFNTPLGLAVDKDGYLYVADSKNNVIRKIVTQGYTVNPALPAGLSIDSTGTISGTPVNVLSTTTYTVTAFNGAGTSSASFTLKVNPSPAIFSFSPYSSGASGTVTIKGANLSGATAVTIGGLPVGSFFVDNAGTTINLIIGEVASGDVVVTTPNGTAGLGGFIFNASPVISYASVPQKLTAGVPITPITITKSGGNFPQVMYGKVSVLAGSGYYGNADGAAAAATFANPMGAVADRAGNVYVVDANNYKVRKIAADGTVSTFAGTGNSGLVDGVAASAQFNYPSSITIDAAGNLYITDSGNNRLRKITPGGIVSTVGGNSFSYPYGITADKNGDVFVANTYGNNIKKIEADGSVTNAGGNDNGQTGSGLPNLPYGIATGQQGGLYFTDRGTKTLYQVDGGKLFPKVEFPTVGTNMAIDGFSNIYRSDTTSNAILQWGIGLPADRITVFAGNFDNSNAKAGINGSTRGLDTAAVFSKNMGISYDGNGSLIVTDPGHSQIKKINLMGYYLDKPLPKGLVFDYSTGTISGTPVEILPVTTYGIYAYNATMVGRTFITFGIEKGKQEITWATVPTKTYGDADFEPGAISNNAGTIITYTSSDESVVKQVGNKLHIIGAGTATVTASQPQSDAFDAAVPVVKTITINKAELTVTAFDLIRAYNTANPTFYINYKGFVNNEDENALTTKPTLTSTALISSPAGDYPIVPAGGVSRNYSFKYVNGKLTVFPVPVITTPGSFSFQVGGNIVLTATPSTGGYTYQWYKNAVAITGANAATLTVTEAGSYAVSINANNYTTFATPVDVSAVFTLPVNNFKVTINGTSCKGNKDGKVTIAATKALAYVAHLSIHNVTTTFKFTDKLEIPGLEPGIYSLCITVEGQTYTQCFAINITEPKDLAAYIAVNKTLSTLNLSMENGAVYNIQLNGKSYTTTNGTIALPLSAGNNRLSVSTDKPCQGVFEKIVSVSDQVAPYPNPFQNTLYVNLGENYRGNAKLSISNAVTGQQAFLKSYTNCSGVLELDVASLHNGLYVMHLSLDNNTELVYKILKK